MMDEEMQMQMEAEMEQYGEEMEAMDEMMEE
jgi:hypothetical protein